MNTECDPRVDEILNDCFPAGLPRSRTAHVNVTVFPMAGSLERDDVGYSGRYLDGEFADAWAEIMDDLIGPHDVDAVSPAEWELLAAGAERVADRMLSTATVCE